MAPNPHPPFQTDVRGAPSMERRTEERSACGALMQHDHRRARALDVGGGGGAARGGKGACDAFARQDRASVCTSIHLIHL